MGTRLIFLDFLFGVKSGRRRLDEPGVGNPGRGMKAEILGKSGIS